MEYEALRYWENGIKRLGMEMQNINGILECAGKYGQCSLLFKLQHRGNRYYFAPEITSGIRVMGSFSTKELLEAGHQLEGIGIHINQFLSLYGSDEFRLNPITGDDVDDMVF